MKKTIFYLLVLALLGSGIYFLILKKNGNPFGNNEAGFSIKDTANIYKIFLSSMEGETITVERKPGGWVLNNKYKALPSTVNLVLGALATQEPRYPVTQNAKDNATKLLSTDGIKVELYTKDGKKYRVFYVGGASANGAGTNMLMEGSTKPYVVQVPTFSGDLRPRYPLDIMDWRDRTVFDIPSSNIKKVSVQYLDKPINSFVLSQENGKYSVIGDPSVTVQLDSLNTNRVKIYLGYFTNVNCEGILNGKTDIDSVMKTSPKRCNLDVELVDGSKQHADIYWMLINKRSKNQLSADPDVPDDYDADRMFAVTNEGKDTLLIQTLTFRKILRKAFDFYSKEIPRNAPEQHPNNLMMRRKG